jgi:hypothetical protein
MISMHAWLHDDDMMNHDERPMILVVVVVVVLVVVATSGGVCWPITHFLIYPVYKLYIRWYYISFLPCVLIMGSNKQ